MIIRIFAEKTLKLTLNLFESLENEILVHRDKNDYLIINNNNNTTSSEQRISYYRSDDTDVEAEEIEAPAYKKMRGVRKI
ncbi:hypothetical protein BpHYR1_006106 [Brachionus plicatilis]|uniref:Uncharacterized protein n=1 Tax=Brachionus plicatilis TaxID=10195 RepID=A0A3M7R0M9_BRAPC|nr:hypothetical protein BpHYR1_006106 [Brachionus plicatilis]